MTSTKTPAAIAAEAILYDVFGPNASGHNYRLAAWTAIIAQACADACAKERERVARMFDEEARKADAVVRTCGSATDRVLCDQVRVADAVAARIRASGTTSGTTPAQPEPAQPMIVDLAAALGVLPAGVRPSGGPFVAPPSADAEPERTAAAERADVPRYFVSPDGTNGYMEWHVMRRESPTSARATGVSFSDEADDPELTAQKVADLLNGVGAGKGE